MFRFTLICLSTLLVVTSITLVLTSFQLNNIAHNIADEVSERVSKKIGPTQERLRKLAILSDDATCTPYVVNYMHDISYVSACLRGMGMVGTFEVQCSSWGVAQKSILANPRMWHSQPGNDVLIESLHFYFSNSLYCSGDERKSYFIDDKYLSPKMLSSFSTEYKTTGSGFLKMKTSNHNECFYQILKKLKRFSSL